MKKDGRLISVMCNMAFSPAPPRQRPRYLNARTTLQTLLHRFNAVPIVNENDTVSVSELRFGDNDTLSAITAGLIDADYLFLLTDVDGLYTGNPRTDAGARRLGVIDNVAKVRKLVNVSSLGSNFGTGGMMTKLIAAELATAAGVATVIVNGSAPGNIVRVVEKGLPEVGAKGSSSGGDDDVSADARMASSLSSLDLEQEKHAIGLPELTDPPHTIFLPVRHPLKARKWSILHALHPTGTIVIDEGAYRRIARPESGGRLLPAGVVGVEGTWERMQAVRLVARRRAGHGHGAAVTATAAVAAAAAATALSAAPEHESARDESMSAVGTATPPAPPALTKRLTAYLHGESGTGTPGSSSGHVGAGIDSHVSAPGDTIPPPMLPPPPPPPSGPASATTPPAWELVEIGRGLANYNSIDCERIKGLNRYVSCRVVRVGNGWSDVTDAITASLPWCLVLTRPAHKLVRQLPHRICPRVRRV